MRNEQTAFEARQYTSRQYLKCRRIDHHCVRNAGERLNLHGDAALRIYQTLPFFNDCTICNQHDADFGDAVAGRADTGGFQIDDGQF